MLLPCNNLIGPLGRTRYVASSSGVESAWCLSFDGVDDRVDMASATSLTQFTISGWVYLSADGHFVADNTTAAKYSRIILKSSDSQVWFSDDSGGTYVGSAIPSGWNHVCLTYNGSTSVLYVNGSQSGTSVSVSGKTFGVSTVGGKRGAATGVATFKGRIDDVRIYSRALSSTEVTALFTNTSPPTTGLTFHLPMEEGTGTTTVDAVGGVTATLTNGPVWHPQTPPKLVSGRITSARSLSFDGSNDYVSVASSSSMAFGTSDFSAACWINMQAWSVNKEYNVLSKTAYYQNSNGWLIEVSTYSAASGKYAIQWSNTGQTAWGQSNVATTLTLSTSQWYHVAFVRSGTTAYCYLDGVLVSTKTHSAVGISVTNSVDVMLAKAIWDSYFPGLIDDPRIFSRAISAADIRKLCRGQNPTVNDPVGWWKLDETSGTTAVDSGSGGNNGTHVNGPTISTDVPAWLSA